MARKIFSPLTSSIACGVMLSACAASTPMGRQFDQDRPQLTVEWSVPMKANDGFAVGSYSVVDLHPKRAPDRSGKTYGFSVSRSEVEPSPVEEGVLLWSVTGVGSIGIRQARATISELVELRRPGSKDSAWTLEIYSGVDFQLVGELRGKDKTYNIDSVPMGTLLLGENYGTKLICFLENGEIVAAVDIATDPARIMMRPNLDPETTSVFVAASTALALRSYVLGATGSALKFIVQDPAWIARVDCGGDLACQMAERDAITMAQDAARARNRSRTGSGR